MFVRTGKGADDFRSAACDAQLGGASSEDMAKFWLRFLGGVFTIEPRVATQRFFDASLDFINGVVTDPIQKNDIYEHLHSQLKVAKKSFAPRSFIEEYVPQELQGLFRDHLKGMNISLTAFAKDVSDIQTRLRRQAFHTERGVLVSVPAENSQVVKVTKEQIVVNDSLLHVDHR